jgi:hypothetical protein
MEKARRSVARALRPEYRIAIMPHPHTPLDHCEIYDSLVEAKSIGAGRGARAVDDPRVDLWFARRAFSRKHRAPSIFPLSDDTHTSINKNKLKKQEHLSLHSSTCHAPRGNEKKEGAVPPICP